MAFSVLERIPALVWPDRTIFVLFERLMEYGAAECVCLDRQ
jgi:hypothetical protein